MSTFSAADILLPDPEKISSYEKWAVIACDQFTSEPEYWQKVRGVAGDSYSACNLILPEAELSVRGEDYIKQIHLKMAEYRARQIYREYPDSLVYVERTQSDGSVRRGIVGCIDLEDYDYSVGSSALIRATEKTVIERIPPRVAVREWAPSELSHVILYADDEKDALIGPVSAARDKCECLYDFDLMLGGGHISGYLVNGPLLDSFMGALTAYYQAQDGKAAAAGTSPVYFTVADGNHSLASAKVCYEKAKKNDPQAASASKLRMAMVEVENLHDDSQVILPIHRLMTGIDTRKFIAEMSEAIALPGAKNAGGHIVLPWLTAGSTGEMILKAQDAGAAIVDIQEFIDGYIEKNGGTVDYIHGDASLRSLAGAGKALGLMMPAINKGGFFANIMSSGVYPRKTFSVGEATDKRYYLEIRDLY